MVCFLQHLKTMVSKDTSYHLEFSSWCQINTDRKVLLSIAFFLPLSWSMMFPLNHSHFSLSQPSELYCMYQTLQIWKTKALISHVNPCNFMHLLYEKVNRSQDTTEKVSTRAVLKIQSKKYTVWH